jgi:TctA family transporter
MIDNLILGAHVAFSTINLLYALIGCFLGTLIGVLPGVGPLAAISMLLPATYGIEPVSALVMLAGIYYGAQYGGSTTSILLNIPGETSSVVTLLDGRPLALKGQAGKALYVAGIGSFFAGCCGTLIIASISQPLTRLAFEFGPTEYVLMMLLGILGSSALSSGSTLDSFGMVIVGVLLGVVGTDPNSGVIRFGLGIDDLTDGFNFVLLSVGLFGYSELITSLSEKSKSKSKSSIRDTDKVKVYSKPSLGLSWSELKSVFPAIVRGTGIGAVIGLLPGGGVSISTFAAYAVEKSLKLRAGEVELGSGNLRGVAAPESANNSAAQTAFIPMLVMGIPYSAIMAIMLGTLVMHGIPIGPNLISNNPSLFWGLIVSMLIGNSMLIILNLPLVSIWIKILSIDYRNLAPAVLLLCTIGVYSTNNSTLDVLLISVFGVVGFVLSKIGLSASSLMLGFILGPMLEENLRRAMIVYDGHWIAVAHRPMSITLVLLLITVIAYSVFGNKNKQMYE